MLTKQIAQKIVDEMANIVPYDINIMNSEGIIIGSTNKNRIGTIHYGAAEALTNKSEVKIYNEDEFVKPGLNIPIMFRDEIDGVIGITGNPEEASAFGKIIKVTAELLLSHQYSIKSSLKKEMLKEEFLYEWIYLKDKYNNDFILKGRSLNINVTNKKSVAIVYHKNIQTSRILKTVMKILNTNDYYIKLSDEKLILIFDFYKDINSKVQNIYKALEIYEIKISVSSYNHNLNVSFLEAIETLNIMNTLYENQYILYYDKVRLFQNSIEHLNYGEIEKIITRFNEHNGGEELLETLIKYIELNGEKNKVAESLHIHRNTLNYRLNNIEDLINLKLNDYMDLFQLILFYIGFRIKK